MLIPVNNSLLSGEEVIDVQVVHDKFPEGEVVVAIIDPISFYEDEFQETLEMNDLENIDKTDWHVAGIGVDSSGTYYVMDMTKVFVNTKTGQTLPYPDFNIYSGGSAFEPVLAQDCEQIIALNGAGALEAKQYIM
jgi:hypothetical protein